MANLRGLIARGGKSGAFALGFSDKMKSVAGAMAVLALATTGTVVVQSQVAPAAQAAQDPVESPGEWRAQKTVNGNVFLNREGTRSRYTPGDGDEPLAGVKVYAQWIDYNNKKQRGAVSPIYTAQSKADGTYSISLPDWTDALGTVHKWEATAGQKLRIWADNPNPENLQLAFVEGDSVFGGQGDRYFGTWNGTVGIQRVVDFNISYHEREQDWLFLPEDQQTKDQPLTSTGTTTPPGQLLGFVWYEQRGTFGDLQATPRLEGRYGDVAIPGVKVRASYVQDEVARRFDQWAADNKGYTHEKFREAQKQIMADYEAETGKSAIAETAVGETGNDGMYRIQFKGLYGSSYKTKGLLVPGDKWGELAGSSTEGTFLNGQSGSKHVNYEYMYVSPVLPDGVDAQMDVTQTAMFQDTGRFPAYTSIERTADSQINLDFTLRQTSRGFDVLEYNTTDKPAAPGDTAKTDTFGLTPNTAHVIVWTDSEGKEVHRCEANSDNLGVIPSCDFTVPEDLAKDTVYTATVYNASDESTALMADSFLAYVAPEYKETEVKVGEEATAERPVNKNGTAVPDSAKFAAATAEDVKNAPEFQKAGLPEDVAPQDWVTVNADGTLTIKPGADVKPGTYNVPVKVTYEDGTTKVINAPIKVVDETKQSDEFEPAYEEKLVVPGEETKSSPTFTKAGKDENGEPTEEKVDVPADSKFAIPEDFKAPEGYEVSIDENSGEITVTYPDKSKLNKDTVEEFNVPVTVTYPDGSKDDAKANFKLDTDNDGKPDTEDDDDDNDGIPDKDDSNPKVPNANDHYDPKYEDGSGKPGSDVKIDAPSFTDKNGKDTTAPEGTKFTKGEGAPEGVTVDENTGAITVTIPEDAKPGDKITVPVVVTYPDGTKDNVDVTVTVTEKDNGVYEPAYEDKLVVPGKETKSSPTFTDKEGKDAKAPEGSKFTIGEDFTVPEGYEVKIDESNGEITVTVDGDKLNKDTVEEFDVPVTVTYPDGSTDKTDANFKLDTDNDGKPDTEDDDDDDDGIPDEVEKEKGSNPKDKGSIPATPIEPGNPTNAATYEPGYEDGSGKPGSDVKIEAPKFTDKDGNDTKAPEGTKFTPGENVPDGVTIDENTGEITVTIPEDAKPGDKITVPVVVTYPDGTKDNVDVTITVEQPDAKTADEIEPEYKDGSGKPGEDVKVEKPEFKDKDGNPTTAPEGTKFTPGENTPDGVTIDENTGAITVPVPEDAKPGDKITVPVVVTYPDESTDEVTVTVTVEEPDAPEQPDVPAKVDYRPAYGDAVVVPAGGSKSAEITYDGPEAPEGTEYVLDPNYTVPHGWDIKVDPNTGTVTATVVEAGPNGARQEELVVPVLVKYPESANATGDDVANATFLLDTDKDGTPDTTDEDDDGDGFTDEEEKEKGSDPKDPDSKPEAPVNDFQPSYEEKTVPAGQSVTSDVTFTGEPKPEGTTFSIADNFVAPHGWTFEVDPETGTVTATVVPAGPDGARQEQVIVPIVVTYPDGTATSDDTANAVFNLDTDGDGKPDSTDDDDDGDGFTDEEEKEKGTDPKDPNSKPQPDAPEAEKPDWNDDKGKPGDKVEIPNNGGPVQDGTTVETEGPGKAEIDENGNLVVDIDKDANPGDKVVVIVKDKDGNEIDRVVVEVEKPDAPAKDPKWEDTTTTPDKPVEIPNTGGDVPEGTTVETEGPGKAEIKPDGTITVTPDKDAKPGDKIKVVVKDKDGKVIDEVTVTITEKPKPGGSSDLPEGLIPGLIGGGIIGGIIGNNLGSSHGSSTPGHGAGKAPADKGAQGADKGAGNQGGKGAGQSGTSQSGQSGAAQSGASSSSAGRQGSLAVTGVSGVAIMLGAAAMALAIGGALLAGRRRREN